MSGCVVPVQRYRFALRAREPISLPSYKGSALRGGFGYAFKRIACALRRQDCPKCMLKGKCAYSYVFETPPPQDAEMMRLYPIVPKPFVLEPPEDSRERIDSGEEIAFGLVLIGRAIDFLPHFVFAFMELGRMGLGRGRGGFDLASVAVVADGRGARQVFGEGDEQIGGCGAPEAFDLLARGGAGASAARLDFRTPARIRYGGRYADSLPFHVLIRNLLRRASALLYFHCGGDPRALDFRGLIARAAAVEIADSRLRWHDWGRYSSRQDARMQLGGVLGGIAYRGDLRPFLALLRLGAALHIGKNTTFGLGRYTLALDESNAEADK